jgi:hypothetical protein
MSNLIDKVFFALIVLMFGFIGFMSVSLALVAIFM